MAHIEKTIIEFRNVSFGFPEEKLVLREMSLSIKKGAFYLVQGPSGTGKSTFLRLINRLEEPLSGDIRFKNKRLTDYHPPHLRRSLLYIQQTPTAVDGSVRHNLLLPFSFKQHHRLPKPDGERIEALLRDVRLDGVKMNDHARALSVGQLQRLCLVRGLLLNPEVLLLDEPTSALDPESAHAVMTTLERINRTSHLTILAVTHKGAEAENMPCRYLHLKDGRIREDQ